MTQSNYNIPNDSAPAVRAQLNAVFGSIATNNSGSSAPATTFPHQWWYDTTTNILKQRNAADSAWIDIGSFDQTGGTFTPAGQREIATQTEAETGTDNSKVMTPLRTRQSVDDRIKVFQSTTPVSFSAGGLQTWAHGLGAEPQVITFIFECVTADNGFSPGDRLYMGGTMNFSSSSQDVIHAVWIDDTNINVRWDSNAVQLAVMANKNTGASTLLTPARWQIYVSAVRFR